LLCALSLLPCSYLLGSNQSSSQSSLRRLAIVDPKGRERIVLGTNPGGLDRPELKFLDTEGRTRLTIEVDEHNQPDILLLGADETVRMRLGADNEGGSMLTMGVPLNGSLILLQAGGAGDQAKGYLWVKNATGHSLLESKVEAK
jgi:hypothetical protein